VPFRIIKEAIERESEREERKQARRKKGEEKEKERPIGTAKEQRKKKASDATSASFSSTFYRFVKVRKRVLTPHARETSNTHAGTHVRRTHARTHPFEGSRKPAAREGS